MPTLEWIGKDKVINHHQQVPYRVLEEKYTYNAEKSDNMIIRGDNLEALKALLPKYEGRIKCIYIDPPYNTAKSSDKNKAWVYSDNVDHPKIKAWIGLAVGDEGEDLSRHDKWLCMMYPRLKLLHKLLSLDGAILISIDDNEYSRLKELCDEIFGNNNHVKTFIWYTAGHTDNQDYITGVHEYILCYAKDKNKLFYNSVVDPNVSVDSKILRSFAENSITKNGYKNPPSFVVLPEGFPCEVETLELDKHKGVGEFIEAVEEQGYITRELTKQFGIRIWLMFVTSDFACCDLQSTSDFSLIRRSISEKSKQAQMILPQGFSTIFGAFSLSGLAFPAGSTVLQNDLASVMVRCDRKTQNSYCHSVRCYLPLAIYHFQLATCHSPFTNPYCGLLADLV